MILSSRISLLARFPDKIVLVAGKWRATKGWWILLASLLLSFYHPPRFSNFLHTTILCLYVCISWQNCVSGFRCNFQTLFRVIETLYDVKLTSIVKTDRTINFITDKNALNFHCHKISFLFRELRPSGRCLFPYIFRRSLQMCERFAWVHLICDWVLVLNSITLTFLFPL